MLGNVGRRGAISRTEAAWQRQSWVAFLGRVDS